ncbi:MAG: L,D-transpeptidase family protein [Verrucomicrobiales bacterium]|nr:L,D-transpeptidase family protein [Verrucomicrobiales bacterium]
MKRSLSTLLLVAVIGALPLALTSCGTIDQNASLTKKSNYKRVSGSRINHMALKGATKSNTRVVVDIADQKAFLLVNGKIAATSPVSTARAGKRTPRGTFSISQKVRSGKISTIYKVEMPYWMRLSGTVFGLHAGYLPGYPASAGCIRMPASMARLFYDHTSYGTRVSIYSSWSGG